MLQDRFVHLIAALLVVTLIGAAAADTIHLKDGRKFEGKVVSELRDQVSFKTFGGVLVFKRSDVDRIERGATKKDIYKERLGALDGNDLAGLFELAEWCEEVKLISQRGQVYRKILKLCPDHPETRKKKKQIHKDGKWVKAPKYLPEIEVEVGETVKVPDTMASVSLPDGWRVETKTKRTEASGPARYGVAPVITVVFGGGDASEGFPEKKGWEKPVDVRAGGLTGKRSRRPFVEDLIDRVEWVASFKGVTLRLTALAMESETFAPAFEIALTTLAFEAPPADYVNKTYGYAVDLPKPKEKWTAEEDEAHDLLIDHGGDQPTDLGRLWIITGNPGEEFTEVQQYFAALRASMMRGGDITAEKEIDFAGEKAKLLDGTHLDGGVPLRSRLLLIEHGKRIYMIWFSQHEFGVKKTDPAWDVVLKTFRFTD